MKKIIILLSILFCASFIVEAAIPITEKQPKEVVVSDKVEAPKKQSKFKKLVNKILKEVDEAIPSKKRKDTGIFNILSLACGILGVILTAATGLGGIPFMIAAIVLGIIGLTRREKFKGMGIAGISLGGGMIVLFFLTIALIAVACG